MFVASVLSCLLSSGRGAFFTSYSIIAGKRKVHTARQIHNSQLINSAVYQKTRAEHTAMTHYQCRRKIFSSGKVLRKVAAKILFCTFFLPLNKKWP